MLISDSEYRNIFKGYYIVDCAVRDRNIFGFALDSFYTDEEVEEEKLRGWDIFLRPKRIALFVRHSAFGDRLGGENLGNWGQLVMGACNVPKGQILLIETRNDRIFVVGSGFKGEEMPVDRDHPDLRGFGAFGKIKTFDGHAFMCGTSRSFTKRIDKDRYDSRYLQLKPVRDPAANILDHGFVDFDMFSDTDIYAAGGAGDLWHFNGDGWRQIHLPTNTWLETVCCGGDGMVYVSGYEGLLFMGREDRWMKIYDGGILLGWDDMVWFEDRAWATGQMGLWSIKDGQVERVPDLPSEIEVCSGNLYVNDGVMLMAGFGGACFRENGEWHSIFTRADMEKLIQDNPESGV